MKTFIYSFGIVFSMFLFSCDKRGKVTYNIKFTTEAITLANSQAAKVKSVTDYYTQFGDYITSLTPTKLTARIWTIGYIDKVMVPGTNAANMLQYIEQNGEKLSMDDPSRIVDFSGNRVVSFNPVIYGRVSNSKQFEDAHIDFSYFYFIPNNFYQEVQLPAQYQTMHFDMFPNANVENNMLKINHKEMFKKVFPNANTDFNLYFIFGNTDSTFVVNPQRERVALSANCPIADPGDNLVIRSNQYSNMVFDTPVMGESVVMNGVLSFDTQGLIQVYAGADNIPYTSDDVFVYAPRFWERVHSRLDVL